MKRWLLSVHNNLDYYNLDVNDNFTFYSHEFPKEGDVVVIYRSSPLSQISHFFTVKESDYYQYNQSDDDRFMIELYKKYVLPSPIQLHDLKACNILDGWITKFREGLHEMPDDVWLKFQELVLEKYPHLIEKDEKEVNSVKKDYINCNAIIDLVKRYCDKNSDCYPCISNEANTQSKIIDPILSCLGWKNCSPCEICQEYSISKEKVDYALRIDGRVEIFIEAKNFKHDLNGQGEKQIENYCTKMNIEKGIVTNGREWKFFHFQFGKDDYLSEKTLICTIDIEKESKKDIRNKFNKYLAKESFLKQIP